MRTRRSNPEGWRSYGPGKFNSMVDSFLYAAIMDGWGGDEVGDVEGPGAYTLMLGNVLEAAEHGAELSKDTLTQAERDEIKDDNGIIMREDDQGFVSVDYYDSEATAREAWKDVENEVAEFYDDEDEAEDEGDDDDEGD